MSVFFPECIQLASPVGLICKTGKGRLYTSLALAIYFTVCTKIALLVSRRYWVVRAAIPCVGTSAEGAGVWKVAVRKGKAQVVEIAAHNPASWVGNCCRRAYVNRPGNDGSRGCT